MSYQWIHKQDRIDPTLGDTLGERRTDHRTAQKVRDALRTRSVHAAAQAMEHQHVALATALRVLGRPEWRRAREG
jgi:hypothetical protein